MISNEYVARDELMPILLNTKNNKELVIGYNQVSRYTMDELLIDLSSNQQL